MKDLLITSINPAVGKTTFTFALALKLRKEDHNVGYFKPISDGPQDSDAFEAKELLKLDDTLDVICPVTITSYEYDMSDEDIEKNKEKIKSSYNKLKAKYDWLIIEGCRKMNYLAFLGLDHDWLADEFDAKVLVISSGEELEDIDRLVSGKRFFQENVLGAVFTKVPDELFVHFNTSICPKIRNKHNLEVFGLVPNRGNLVAPTAKEIVSAVNGKVLAAKDHLDKLVEEYIVGAMEPESALKYFRKSINKAVITGGDRPQVALAAMETDTSIIILTGSILPPAGVMARAEEKEIPLVLVAGDTFSTVQKLTSQHIYGKLDIEHHEKLEAWDKIFTDVRYKELIELLTE